MSEYRAIYKCRLCGEKFLDSLMDEKEVDKCIKHSGKESTYIVLFPEEMIFQKKNYAFAKTVQWVWLTFWDSVKWRMVMNLIEI